MKTAIILALCCSLFAGCRTDHSTSSRVLATPESFAKKIEQFNLQEERIEQLAAHWPESSPKFLDSIHAIRISWADYLRVEPEQRAKLAANGIVLGEEYYQGQEQIIDALSRQLQLIEELMSKKP
jgi:hypothetical protein